VGAKGSPLQLILSGVLHLDLPTGNIPAALIDEIGALPAVREVIPLSLGDSHQGHRIVGTTHAYLARHQVRMAAGRPWQAPMEAVVGAAVARRSALTPGSRFAGQHGLGEGGHAHDQDPYLVTGVLAPTGTVLDRLILTDLASVWQVHEKAVAVDDSDRKALEAEREVTLLQIGYRSPLAAMSLPRWINQNTEAQAAVPAIEIARLFGLLGVGVRMLEGFGAVLLLLAGLSLFATLAAAVQDRLQDLALIRLMGASRGRLFQVVLLQASALGAVALLLGLALGHGAVGLTGLLMAAEGGLALTAFHLAPGEAWAILAAVCTVWLAAIVPALRAYRAPVEELLIG